MPHCDLTLPLLRALLPDLKTQRFGREVRAYRTVGSTNSIAASWAAQSAPEGSLVLAEYQTQGRGRRGRVWDAPMGLNLTFSLVLRPKIHPERLGLVNMAAGIAVAEAVTAFSTPCSARLKWPNDIFLEGKKCCGILLESTLSGLTGPHSLILGIGLNVNQGTFPPDIAHKATSLLLETGRHVPRAPLLAEVLRRMEVWYNTLTEDAGAAILEKYRSLLVGLGESIVLYHSGSSSPIRGTFVEVNECGALVLRTVDGMRAFYAGEVTAAAPF